MDGNGVGVPFQADRIGNVFKRCRDLAQNRNSGWGYLVVAGDKIGCFLQADHQASRFRMDGYAARAHIFRQTLSQ